MRRLQRFDFTTSQYERPNRKWVCGHAVDGKPCQIGPDARGRCCNVAECQPRREGDRWFCTRPNSAGGVCMPGPNSDGGCGCPIPPCVPVRSLRAGRSLVVRWSVIAAIGFVAIAIGSAGLGWLMPGPLTRAHAALENCQSCHATVAQGSLEWVHSAFMTGALEKDSNRCLGCHIAGDRPLQAHGVDPAVLATKTALIEARLTHGKSANAATSASALFPDGFPTDGALACATCHVEHRGSNASLTDISERTCQTCHVEQFDSLSRGHPPFGGYPYARRARIIFDHASHFSRHFAESAAKNPGIAQGLSACVDCHMPAADGRLMATASFDKTCSACHIDQIRGRDRAIGPRGIAFLRIPGIDGESLKAHGYDIGAWPAYADAGLTPYMTLLLAADPQARADLDTVATLDLLDLRHADPDQHAAAFRLAWSVKALLRELANSGGAELRTRLIAAMGAPVDEDTLSRLIASIPRDVLVAATREWLPDIDSELRDYAAGKMAAASPPPSGSGDAPKSRAGSAPAAKDTGDILAAPKDAGDILAAPKDSGDILAAPKDSGDILAAPKDSGEILAAPKDTGGILTAPLAKDVTIADGRSGGDESAADIARPPMAPEKFAALGGWYRQDFAILFLPTGHADPFMKTWLDFTAHAFATPAEAASHPVFDLLSASGAQGQCMKCHSIDQEPGGRLAVNWQPRDAGARPRFDFTQFSHDPHLQLDVQNGCLLCHRVDRDAAFLASYKQRDPREFVANFTPIERETCAECHTSQAAGESCQSCHNYHAGSVATPVMKTKISGAVLP
jgi:hypothetical protein